MDINLLRAISTLLLFLAFIGIVVYVLSRRRRAAFDAAARLPFLDDVAAPAATPPPQHTTKTPGDQT